MSRSAHCLRDGPPGRGRAGEADVVGLGDDRAADLGPGAGDDLPQLGREAGLVEQLRGQQRGEHGLGVGLGDDRVAGEQRREAVAERHRERVVPGRDDADDALGHAVHLGAREHREHPADAVGVEVLVRGTGVVARGQREVGDLEVGVLAGLARLPHDEVDELVLPVEQEVVQAQEGGGALVDRRRGPSGLGVARPHERLGHVGRSRLGDVRERGSADRRRHGVRLAGGAHDPAREGGDVRAIEAVDRGAVVLGVRGAVGEGVDALLAHLCRVGRCRQPCYRSVTSVPAFDTTVTFVNLERQTMSGALTRASSASWSVAMSWLCRSASTRRR